MSTKRSNKTARVLNLIASPSDPVPTEPEVSPVETKPQQEEAAEKRPAKTRSSTTKTKKPSKTAKEKPAAKTAPTETETKSEPQAENISAPEATEKTETKPAVQQAASIPTPQPVVPIVQTVREKEQQVSDDVKQGLLAALQASEPQPVEPALVSEVEEKTPTTIPVEVSESTTAAEPEVAPESQPAAPAPTPTQNSVKLPPQKASEELYTPVGEQDVEYTNVLQELVEENAAYYISNMLQCHCQRCIVDMKALALTNLPSKYVVLEKSKRTAFMSLYAARYEKELNVQMMRACVIVNEHPHH